VSKLFTNSEGRSQKKKFGWSGRENYIMRSSIILAHRKYEIKKMRLAGRVVRVGKK
jgi:hypothetical protein